MREDETSPKAHRYGFIQVMADCPILMRQRVLDRVAVREMRVVKYRGSPHALNDVPFIIGHDGIEVGSSNGVHPEPQPFTDRITTGIARLDGLFLEAACRRGERALFVSFDENARDIVRDLASVGVKLEPYLESGLLQMVAVRTASSGFTRPSPRTASTFGTSPFPRWSSASNKGAGCAFVRASRRHDREPPHLRTSLAA